MEPISWKMGFEIELLAPAGKTRRDLAELLVSKFATQAPRVSQSEKAGSVKRIFYPQSEPSKVVGTPVFENLVLGFQCLDSNGEVLATCVDDLTIRADLKREAPSLGGWYRIISDDKRFLNLIMAQCDASAGQAEVLKPLAALFGMPLARPDKGLFQVTDAAASSVAMAATLPGERHRPCELISPPLIENHLGWLTTVLQTAEELNFTIPKEAAVHLHYEAKKLCSAAAFSKLVRLLAQHGSQLRKIVATNPNCTRLGPIPPALVDAVNAPGFSKLGWRQAKKQLEKLPLNKYCDFNFLNMIAEIPGKNTLEIRILPGTLSAEEIYKNARLFEAILNGCCDDPKLPIDKEFGTVLDHLALTKGEKMYWQAAIKNQPHTEAFQ